MAQTGSITFSRTFNDVLNPWGKISRAEPQRSDLWLTWFTDAITAMRLAFTAGSVYTAIDSIYPYEVQSVSLPELRIKAEPTRRDSRSYQMPSWDEPLDPIKMTFVMNAAHVNNSYLIQILSGWRALVRAGRGEVSSEFSQDYLSTWAPPQFRFNIYVALLRGGAVVASTNGSAAPSAASRGAPRLDAPQMSVPAGSSFTKTDLDLNCAFSLVNCWLGGFQLTDLNYAEGKLVAVNATFYAEDILDVTDRVPGKQTV